MNRAIRLVRKHRKAMTAIQAAILTGIGIAVALIVGYWIWTVVVGSIRTERLNLSLPTAEYSDTAFAGSSGFTITIKIKNSGPSDATIADIRINGKSISEWGSSNAASNMTLPCTIKSGNEVVVVISLAYPTFKHGQTVEVSFVTAANQVYTSSVSLP